LIEQAGQSVDACGMRDVSYEANKVCHLACAVPKRHEAQSVA